MRDSEVGNRGLAKQEVTTALLQLLLQTPHQRRPLVTCLLQRQTAGRAAGKQRGTISRKSLGELRWHLGKAHRHGLGGEDQ